MTYVKQKIWITNTSEPHYWSAHDSCSLLWLLHQHNVIILLSVNGWTVRLQWLNSRWLWHSYVLWLIALKKHFEHYWRLLILCFFKGGSNLLFHFFPSETQPDETWTIFHLSRMWFQHLHSNATWCPHDQPTHAIPSPGIQVWQVWSPAVQCTLT